MTAYARAAVDEEVALDGETLLRRGDRLHRLDVPATTVWRLLPGDAETIGGAIATRLGADPERVVADVAALLERLAADGLVE